MINSAALGTIALFLLGGIILLNASVFCHAMDLYTGEGIDPEMAWMDYCPNIVSYECQENKEFYMAQAKMLHHPCAMEEISLHIKEVI